MIPEHTILSEGFEINLVELEEHLRNNLSVNNFERADEIVDNMKYLFYKMKDLVK